MEALAAGRRMRTVVQDLIGPYATSGHPSSDATPLSPGMKQQAINPEVSSMPDTDAKWCDAFKNLEISNPALRRRLIKKLMAMDISPTPSMVGLYTNSCRN